MNNDTLKNLISYLSGKFGFRSAIIEKDYYITVILNNINTLLSDEIIFKGGTLLNKIYYNFRRLSEDIDFSCAPGTDLSTRGKRSRCIEKIRKRMPDFLNKINLESNEPEGEGFNESRQYIFDIHYPSVIMERTGSIKLEISLRQLPVDNVVRNPVNHFYQDPFTGENLIPQGNIICLSKKEAVAEKLKAAITRKEPAIRDFYDLWHISESKFDFQDLKFIDIYKNKIKAEFPYYDFNNDAIIAGERIKTLEAQNFSMLKPVIKEGDNFNLDKVLGRVYEILDYINQKISK